MSFLQSGIKSYVQASVPMIGVDATTQEAVDALKASGYGTVYTVTPEKKLAGVITFCDLEKLSTTDALRPKSAKDLSTDTRVVAIRENAELWQLLKIMNGENAANKRFERIPVVDSDKRLVGVVDRSSLRSALETVQIPLSGSAML